MATICNYCITQYHESLKRVILKFSPNTCLILFNPIPQMLHIQQTIPWFIFGSSLGIEYWGDGIDFLMGTLAQLFPRQGCPQLEWAVLNPCSLVIPSPILHPHIKQNRDHGLAGGFTHIWDMLGPFARLFTFGGWDCRDLCYWIQMNTVGCKLCMGITIYIYYIHIYNIIYIYYIILYIILYIYISQH